MSSVTTFHFIRHGQTDWNVERRIQGQTDSQLTEEGRQQAKEVAGELKNLAFDAAYSSSSIRARDTATAILNHHTVSLQLRDDMREINLGPWEGNLYAEVGGQYPEQMDNFRNHPHLFSLAGAESIVDLQNRAIKVVNELSKTHRGQQVLLVSHGMWIKSVLAYFEQRALERFWAPPQMANCCHSIVEFEQEQAKIVQYAGLREW